MNQLTVRATIGCLLHDVGKLVYRADNLDGRNHSKSGYDFVSDFCEDESIKECVRFHHKKEIEYASIPDNSPAYIAYIADNIASGADRRLKDTDNKNIQFKKDIPLYSIFNLLKGDFEGKSVKYTNHFNNIPIPTSEEKTITSSDYSKLVADVKSALSSIEYNGNYLNSLLEIMESYTSYIPSSTNSKEVADISHFDHSKITACVGSCISEYLIANSIDDYKTELFLNESSFLDKKAFLMMSLDLSGIQSFIYSIDYEDALKSLRMRSFFLEIFMEHCIDTLLEMTGLSRVNLIYSGGGHCYILLPNTDKVKENITKICSLINHWLIEQFEASLYLSMAYVECSGHDLMNLPVEKSPYSQIFIQLSKRLSENKLNRYSADDIRLLNKPMQPSSRECRICGKVSVLKSKDICEWCDTFAGISSAIFTSNTYVVTNTEIPTYKGFRLPGIEGDVYLYFVDKQTAINFIKNGDIVRVYCKNEPCTGINYARKIFVADYAYSNLISDLLTESTGIKRIAVLRMDVDNLGQAFVKGFEKESEDAEIRYRYCTLSRFAAFSRQLSMFFKYYINMILDENKNRKNRVSVVYSGGDDVFLIGAWEEVIKSALKINDVFNQFTMGRLKLSAGIGIFREKYPIYKSAKETEFLEDKSKSVKGKNSVTLFNAQEEHTYNWGTFKDKVLNEKLDCIKSFFDLGDSEHGNAALYKILSLLRESRDKINIARYAYLLARLKPKTGDKQKIKIYTDFCKKMYIWISDEEDKNQLITAIYIYLYSKRKRSDS